MISESFIWLLSLNHKIDDEASKTAKRLNDSEN